MKQTVNIDVTLAEWFKGGWLIGGSLLLLVPWLVCCFQTLSAGNQTERRNTHLGGAGLAKLGGISRKEVVMAVLVITALGLWIGAKDIIDATTVALVGVSAMVLVRIVSWDDIIEYKVAWNMLVLLATLIAMADGLNRVGFVPWFAKGMAAMLGGLPPMVVMISLVTVFFFVHYMFASVTSHVVAVMPVILIAGLAVPGVPAKTFVLLLCYSLGLMGILTPYAMGPSPIYWGSGYVSRKAFWTMGFVFGVLFCAVLLSWASRTSPGRGSQSCVAFRWAVSLLVAFAARSLSCADALIRSAEGYTNVEQREDSGAAAVDTDVAQSISMRDAVDVVEQALRQHAAGSTVVLPRTSVNVPNNGGMFRVMSGILPETGFFGLKSLTGYPGRRKPGETYFALLLFSCVWSRSVARHHQPKEVPLDGVRRAPHRAWPQSTSRVRIHASSVCSARACKGGIRWRR